MSPRVPVRALEIAESITTLTEAGVWTATRFPHRDELCRRFSTGTTTINAALSILERREVLVPQRDPATKGRIERLLPKPEDAEPVTGAAHERLAALITGNINDGTWTPENFPTIPEFCKQFSVGTNTASKALRQLERDGVVHRSSVIAPNRPGRSSIRYQPVSGKTDKVAYLADQIAADIRSCELYGKLPDMTVMSRRYCVHQQVASGAYRILSADGQIQKMWLPDWSKCTWYAINSRLPNNLIPTVGDKAHDIALDIARRLSEWIYTRNGKLVAKRLPTPEMLRKPYRTSWETASRALRLLHELGLLRELPGITGRIVDYIPLRLASDKDLAAITALAAQEESHGRTASPLPGTARRGGRRAVVRHPRRV